MLTENGKFEIEILLWACQTMDKMVYIKNISNICKL